MEVEKRNRQGGNGQIVKKGTGLVRKATSTAKKEQAGI